METFTEEMGKRIGVKELADHLGLDEKTIRQYYRELGGMRLGRQYLFFERRVIHAIQERTEMGRPGAIEWNETGEEISYEEGGDRVGNRNAANTRKRLEKEDQHGLYG